MDLTKQERLELFLQRLLKANPATNHNEAFNLLSNILNEIEDEFTSIPYSPERWMTDGRMYPPQDDSRRSTENANVARYRNRAHNTFIGNNGSIKIVYIKNNIVLLDKPGFDGKFVGEL